MKALSIILGPVAARVTARPALLAMALWLAGALAALAAGPVAGDVMRLDGDSSPSQGVRITADGQKWVVVGWTVATGPHAGVYLRQRHNYLFWDPIERLGEDGLAAGQPRDLDLAIDAQGRLHAAWTALAGGRRVVMHALLPGGAAPPQLGPLLAAPPPDAGEEADGPGDADFPNLGAAPDGGVVVVWQENRNLRFGVRAARLEPDGRVTDLGRVSSATTAGLAPQILTLAPLRVAWYEIGERGSALRVDEWQPAEARWRPSAMERLVRAFPANSQLLLHATAGGLAATWQEVQSGGDSAIKLGWLPAAALDDVTTPTIETVAPLTGPDGTPAAGDLTRPNLSGSLPVGLTLAWQLFAQGRQSIELGRGRGDGRPVERVNVSPAAERFAALPDHVTQGNWSAIVWTDDSRDGGDGGVYFNEVTWPQ